MLGSRLWAATVLVAITAGVLVGALYLGHRLGVSQEKEKSRIAEESRKQGQEAALHAAAKAIAKIEVKSAPVKESLVREIRTVPVYRDCQHSPDGLRYLNTLITGQEGPVAGPPGLPASDAAE